MRPTADKNGIVHYKLKNSLLFQPVEQVRQKALGEAIMRRSIPTEKQIDFALGLLHGRGYSVNQTDERFKDFGLPVEPGIRVECWLASLSIPEIKTVIDDLKDRPMEFNFE